MHKKHTLTRKNESGFTLIELMVVMAIIAILATAGLSGYTGYIKKARDMTRIADLNAINTIILSEIGSTGLPPDTSEKLYNTILEANNGTLLTDPLVYLDTPDNTYYQHYTKEVCQLGGARTTLGDCYYSYRLCDGNSGYAVGARFESVSNIGLYTADGITAVNPNAPDDSIYEIGNCQTSSTALHGDSTPIAIKCETFRIDTPEICQTVSTYAVTQIQD